jgi:hypothetical protein
MFFAKKQTEAIKFSTRAEAFAYMLAYQMERNVDPMEAAKRAGEFAELYATNMGLPDKATPPLEGVDKYLQQIDKISCYCEQHPKTVDVLIGAASFLGGLVTAKAVASTPQPVVSMQQEPIDFDSVQ